MPQGQRNALAAGEHVAAPLRWPLVNQLQARNPDTPPSKDARLINCFGEYDAEAQEYIIYKRPGLGVAPAQTVSPSPGLGIYTETGSDLVFGVFGTNFVAGVSPLMTTVAQVDGSAPYSWITLGPAALTSRQVVFGNGVAAYYFVLDSGPPLHRQGQIIPITDPAFPVDAVPGWAQVDGTLYVMNTSGSIFGAADSNSAANWDALKVIQASSNADLGVALAKQLNYIVAFKQFTTQVFYDAGNPPPGSPLSPVPDAQIPLGCLHANTVQAIDNTLLWLTSNETISPQIVQMDNLVPTIVSTPAVERLLDGFTWTNKALDVRSWVFKHGGHRFYGLVMVQLNLTLVYDIDQKLWYIWTDWQDNYWPVVSTASLGPQAGTPNFHFGQHISNGNTYPLDGDYEYPNDYGNVFPVDIYTPNLDFGTIRRKHIKALHFRSDQVPQSNIQVRYTDDDFQSWSNFRTVDLSKKKPRLTDCGTFSTRRAYHIRHAKSTSFRIKTIDLVMDMGTL